MTDTTESTKASSKDKALIGEILAEIVNDARTELTQKSGPKLKIGLMSVGSEHTVGDDRGQGELVKGALSALAIRGDVEPVMIGPKFLADSKLEWIETEEGEAAITQAMNDAIDSGAISGAVALHYPFPMGTATIGRVITPLKGREMLIASTTGASATDRVEAMVRNAISGIATAKSLGIERPTVGILNVDGAPSVTRILTKMSENGYEINFGESTRKDGGSLLRGNDILAGAVDVCVTDTLTGNILMKLFSSWNNGGTYETTGFGYGPSVGEGWGKIISIISRASGAPVIANAILYTADAVRGKLTEKSGAEFAKALKCGFKELVAPAKPKQADDISSITPPPAEPTDEEVHGVDVLSIDEATHALWAKGIYAEASMGCTGPVVKIPGREAERAKEILRENGYI